MELWARSFIRVCLILNQTPGRCASRVRERVGRVLGLDGAGGLRENIPTAGLRRLEWDGLPTGSVRRCKLVGAALRVGCCADPSPG